MTLHFSARAASQIGIASTKGVGLQAQCKYAGLPVPQREYRFDESIGRRRWRFDFAFLEQRVAVEVDGGVWTGGRHVRGVGYRRDVEKMAEAMCQGWIVLRVMPEHVNDGRAVNWIERILAWRKAL
jgi:very-short-patch-repair endonuclease